MESARLKFFFHLSMGNIAEVEIFWLRSFPKYLCTCSSTYYESTPNVKEKQSNFCLGSLSPLFKCSPVQQSTSNVGDSVLNLLDAFKHSMTPRLKQLVNHLFKLMVVDTWGYDFYSFVQDDFLNVSLNAII